MVVDSRKTTASLSPTPSRNDDCVTTGSILINIDNSSRDHF